MGKVMAVLVWAISCLSGGNLSKLSIALTQLYLKVLVLLSNWGFILVFYLQSFFLSITKGWSVVSKRDMTPLLFHILKYNGGKHWNSGFALDWKMSSGASIQPSCSKAQAALPQTFCFILWTWFPHLESGINNAIFYFMCITNYPINVRSYICS